MRLSRQRGAPAKIALAVAVAILGSPAGSVFGQQRSESAPSSGLTFHTAAGIAKVFLYDNATANDLCRMAPVITTLKDRFAREKVGALPRSLAVDGDDRVVFEPGEVGYSIQSSSLVVFPRGFPLQDRFVRIGRVEEGLDLIAAPGPIEVRIDKDD